MDRISDREVLDAIEKDLGDWRKLAQPIAARYRAADSTSAAAFVAAVARAGAQAGHDVPEIQCAGRLVDVRLYSVGENGGRWITAKDLELASAVTRLARDAGLTPVPTEVQQIELALDTADDTKAGPFWAALLTGDVGNTVFDSVFDPTHRAPCLWFQATDSHPVPRQRWHLDVWLAPEVAEGRISAAVAAGGVVVDRSHAPSYTVLSDPEGNRVCVCTAVGRD
ncbi:VOC family protein [Streptomyces sp. NPDC050535]|uniref:VOC family protein n=1 Tax=Streptomyces sp. NPDC050535 TaxID=3365626 RepID=UPI0037A4D781